MPLTKVEFPSDPQPPLATEPSLLVIYARPKAGKTTLVTKHPHGLIIDTQRGTYATAARRVDLRGEYHKAVNAGWKHSMYSFFLAVMKDLQERGGTKTLIIDTFGDIEDMIMEQLDAMYSEGDKALKVAPEDLGRIAVAGSSIANLPHGAGWEKLRTAVKGCLGVLRKTSDQIILILHPREKLEDKTSRVAETVDLELRGKVRNIVAGESDGVGFFVRKDTKGILTFRSGDAATGNRFTYLSGKEFVISEQQPDGTVKVDWSLIYPSLKGVAN